MSHYIFDFVDKLFQNQPLLPATVSVFAVGDIGGVDRLHAYAELLKRKLVHNNLTAIPELKLVDSGDQLAGLMAPPSDESEDRLRCATLIDVLPDMQSESLIDYLEMQEPGTIVIIPNASRLRFASTPAASLTPSIIELPEDVWVPHVLALISHCARIAESRRMSILIDLGCFPPHRPEWVKDLENAEANLVMRFSEGGSNSALEQSLSQWPEWIRSGNLKSLFESIDILPGKSAGSRSLLRAQIFLQLRLVGHALDEIRAIASNEITEADVLALLAQVASNCGAPILAQQFLRPAIAGIRQQEALESALIVAERIPDAELTREILARLAKDFPRSEILLRYSIRMACLSRDYDAAANYAASLPGAADETAAFTFLAERLSTAEIPNYGVIAQDIVDQLPSWSAVAREALVRDAMARGLIVHAFNLMESFPSTFLNTRSGTLLAIDALQQVLMARAPKVEHWVVDGEQMQFLVGKVLDFLANSPSDVHVYGRTVHLFTVEGGGSFGVPSLLARLGRTLRGAGWKTTAATPPISVPTDEIQRALPTLKEGLAWLEQNQPVVLGQTRLPERLLLGSPIRLVAIVTRLLQHFDGTVQDDLDMIAIENWLALGLAAAAHLPDTLEDLRLINAAGLLLAQHGHAQRARDLAQQVLLIAGADEQRRRLAWSVAMSIQVTSGANVPAMIALACALGVDVSVEPKDGWQEANNLTKMFRNAGLFSLAMQAWHMTGALLLGTGNKDVMWPRHVHLGLTIRMVDVLHRAPNSAVELEPLVSDVVALAKEILTGNSPRGPIQAMLGQLITHSEKNGVPLSPDAKTTLERLKASNQANDPVVDAATLECPNASDLLAVHLKYEPARFAADIADEARPVAILARRFISRQENLKDASEMIFAIELLADRAVASPGWVATPVPVPKIVAIEDAASIALQASLNQGSVMMLALDLKKALIRVDLAGGKVAAPVRVPLSQFSGGQLDDWKKRYPYDYADESAPNAFFISTEPFRFEELPRSPIMLVASTTLQCLPPHLWRVNNGFAGLSHAITSIPSVSWFRAAQALALAPGRKKFAWISSAVERGQTLAMVADRLDEAFATHGITLNSDGALPSNFSTAKLAVVTAHGGTAPAGTGFFARISDEGELSVNADELVRALRNVDVVILFVCSGGRSDKNPGSETTSGLVKQLFEAGCSAVIGSPWPLDPRVTYHWLPVFLNAWQTGKDLATATLQANQAVAAAFPGDFAKSLAMHCFGNPFIGYA